MEQLREALSRSHVGAATIAFLLLFSLDSLFQAVWPPFWEIVDYVVTALAILGVPSFSWTSTRMYAVTSYLFLYSSVATFVAAWLLSNWVFGVGPIRCLSEERQRFLGRTHA